MEYLTFLDPTGSIDMTIARNHLNIVFGPAAGNEAKHMTAAGNEAKHMTPRIFHTWWQKQKFYIERSLFITIMSQVWTDDEVEVVLDQMDEDMKSEKETEKETVQALTVPVKALSTPEVYPGEIEYF